LKGRAPAAAFLERTLSGIAETLEHHRLAAEVAAQEGLLQQLDPRAKLLAILVLIAAAVAARHLPGPGFLLLLAFVLAWKSCVPAAVLGRLWIAIFLFTGVMALPALFLTPGPVWTVVPGIGWRITANGGQTALLLVLRAMTCSTFALLLVLTTPWTNILKALHAFHVPTTAIVIVGMTYRYILLLLELSREQWEARRSRIVGQLGRGDDLRLAAANAAVLLGKSLQLSSDVYLAMQSRGYSGTPRTLHDFAMKKRDWLALAASVAIVGIVFVSTR
jgi:cobalt/nickel transport system permease protein